MARPHASWLATLALTVLGVSFRSPSDGERNETPAAKPSIDYLAQLVIDYRDHSHPGTLIGKSR